MSEKDEIKSVPKLNFLGMAVEKDPCKKYGFCLHQFSYITTKLAERNMRNGDGKAVLPQPPEGRVEPQDKTTKEYAADLAEAQKEVGTLQWLAIKTRPDIAASCSAAASLTCGCPKACIQMCIGIWRYVAATWHYKIIVSASDEGSWTLLIATDASLSPGGGRSRSGVVVLLNGVPVH